MKTADITKNPPRSKECIYRVAYLQVAFSRGRSANLGLATLDYSTPSGLTDAVVTLTRKGYRVLGTWRWSDRWIRM